MTKEEIEKQLQIPRRSLDRTVMRCEEKGLLQPAIYGEGNRRVFSEADFQAICAYRHNNGTARHEAVVSGQLSVVSKNGNGKPDVNEALQILSEKIGAVIEARLFVEELYRVRDLPIPRNRALAAIHSGELKAFKNRLGRGWRIKKSDWQKFLRGIK